jgi:cytochrome c oxidase subunit 2
VNHGFALYDPEFRVVAETQAMPGYTNVLRYTFREPGTYQVLCLEYCGVAHHAMMAQIKVTDR